MSHTLYRALLGIALLALLSGSIGCAKRVPVEDGTFEAQQRVVLTLKQGETIKGHIDQGKRVEYVNPAGVYQARIAAVTEDRIELQDLNLVEERGSYGALSARLADARVRVAEPIDTLTVSRADVEKVEWIRFDTGRTVRKTSFWAYGGALLVLFLSQRS